MPISISKVKGKPVGLYLKYLGASTSAPADITITLTADAAVGANTLAVSLSSATAIPKNTVLTFDDASATKVVVSADFASATSGNLSVVAFEGPEGAGIANALATDDAATWDQLYTDPGASNAPYANNPGTQNLNAVTYGSAAEDISLPEITNTAPTITRSGLYPADGQLTQDILTYGDTNGNWWVKRVLPDATGAAYETREGLAIVSDVSDDDPADGLISLSYTVRFKTKPTPTFAS